MGNEVAYNGKGGSYFTNNVLFDEESLESLVDGFKTRGLSANQISEKLNSIEAHMMNPVIAVQHPDKATRDHAREMSRLTDEDLDEIYLMTQGCKDSFGDLPTDDRVPYFGNVNPDANGMSIINRRSLIAQKAADSRAMAC